VKRFVWMATVAVIVGGCASSRTNPSAASAVGPQLSVERFLQAANTRDFEAMSRVFGTADGPIGDTGSPFGCFWKKIGTLFGGESCIAWEEVELRMDTLARILQHEDYQIASERDVAGRAAPTSRVGVDLVVSRSRTVRDVGFRVVRGGDRWFVEEIDLEKVTGGED